MICSEHTKWVSSATVPSKRSRKKRRKRRRKVFSWSKRNPPMKTISPFTPVKQTTKSRSVYRRTKLISETWRRLRSLSVSDRRSSNLQIGLWVQSLMTSNSWSRRKQQVESSWHPSALRWNLMKKIVANKLSKLRSFRRQSYRSSARLSVNIMSTN